MNLIETAMELALRAHGGQTRKGTKVPYIVHPVSVALILARHGFDNTVIAAGLVHDVVEDTHVSLGDLSQGLGDEVTMLVASLTQNDTLSWEEKKKAYIEMVRNSGDAVKAIATADKIANAESLLEAHAEKGENVWNDFNAGRNQKLWFERAMLTMLESSWKHPLIDEYRSCVERLERLV